jgi:hypothetical protein
MALEKPNRLMLPSPDARVARTPVPDGEVLLVATPFEVFIPVVQWSSIRIRGRINTQAGAIGVQFVRPARNPDPASPNNAFVYTADQPAINATAWVAGTEFSLEVSAVEHQGENWLKITLTPSVDGAVVAFFDVSGVLLGTYH